MKISLLAIWKYFRRAALFILLIELFSVSYGQQLPLEFRSLETERRYIDMVTDTFPFLLLIVLTGAIRKKNTRKRNQWILMRCFLIAGGSYILISIQCFFIGFGGWEDRQELLKGKDGSRVVEQGFDCGALGYGGIRRVLLIPVSDHWQLVVDLENVSLPTSPYDFMLTN